MLCQLSFLGLTVAPDSLAIERMGVSHRALGAAVVIRAIAASHHGGSHSLILVEAHSSLNLSCNPLMLDRRPAHLQCATRCLGYISPVDAVQDHPFFFGDPADINIQKAFLIGLSILP